MGRAQAPIDSVDAAFTVPPEAPEADGTLRWGATTLVTVEVRGGGHAGLRADAMRCAGITGFLRAAQLCEAKHAPLSAHTAPGLHLHPSCALKNCVAHLEYFHDRVRTERALFDGLPPLADGRLRPDRSRTGHGLSLRHRVAERYLAR